MLGLEEPPVWSKSSSAAVGKERTRPRKGRRGQAAEAGGTRPAGANSTVVDRSFSGSPTKSLRRFRKKTQSNSPMKLAQWRKFGPLAEEPQLSPGKADDVAAAEDSEPRQTLHSFLNMPM